MQQELAEYYAVSQSTISRAITAVTPRLAQVLRQFTPTAEELPPDAQLIVDGTLVSCWSWDNHNELYSSKHHATGLNLWRILHTDYRRPLTTFRETISAVVGLQFYRLS